MPLGENIIIYMEWEEYDSNSCVWLGEIWATGVGNIQEQKAVSNKVRIAQIFILGKLN